MIEIINIGPDGARRIDLEFKKHPHSIIKVHHPECGHCKAMEKDWTGLEEELKKNYNGDIGIITVHSDAISNTNVPALKTVNGFPTIMAVKDGEPIQYAGNRSKDDMLKFSLKNLNLEKKSNSYTGGKRKTKKRRSRKTKTKRRHARKTKKRHGRKGTRRR